MDKQASIEKEAVWEQISEWWGSLKPEQQKHFLVALATGTLGGAAGYGMGGGLGAILGMVLGGFGGFQGSKMWSDYTTPADVKRGRKEAEIEKKLTPEERTARREKIQKETADKTQALKNQRLSKYLKADGSKMHGMDIGALPEEEQTALLGRVKNLKGVNRYNEVMKALRPQVKGQTVNEQVANPAYKTYMDAWGTQRDTLSKDYASKAPKQWLEYPGQEQFPEDQRSTYKNEAWDKYNQGESAFLDKKRAEYYAGAPQQHLPQKKTLAPDLKGFDDRTKEFTAPIKQYETGPDRSKSSVLEGLKRPDQKKTLKDLINKGIVRNNRNNRVFA